MRGGGDETVGLSDDVQGGVTKEPDGGEAPQNKAVPKPARLFPYYRPYYLLTNRPLAMSFLSSAECGSSSNPLNQLLKQSQTDRSLQQGDRFSGGASGSQQHGGNAFRSAAASGGMGQMNEEFMRGGGGAGVGRGLGGGAFDFDGMRREMEMMRAKGAPAPQTGNWANEMSRMSNGPPPPQHLQQPPSAAGGAQWRDQFQQQQQPAFQRSGSPAAGMADTRGPGGSGIMGGYSGGGMGMMGMGMGMSMGGGSSFSNQMNARNQNTGAATATTDKGKSRIVELDDASWEAQFKALDEAQAAAEAEAKASADKGKGKAAESEEDQDAAVRKALDGIEDDITAEGREADERFQELWNAMQSSTAGDRAEVEDDLAKWEEELNSRNEGVGYRHPGGGIAGGDGGLLETGGWDGTEDHLLDGFGTIGPDGYPRLGNYRIAQQNPYLEHVDPLAEGLRLLTEGGSLTDATLAFEAATAKPQTGGTGGEPGEVDRERRARSEAWRRLGEAQAMNERETQAIRALEEAVRVDEGNLEAYMALAISYINEGYDTAAHSTLQRYINRAYPHLKAPPLPEPLQGSTNPLEADSTTNPWATLNAVTSLFLSAARENAQRGIVDAEVQVGLGVLFYADSSYEKAEDCFRAALEVRPNDFLLWNRLGATFANGGKPEMAIEAYHKALELRPTFTRAIYNLSVSCLNLGAHHEAAEHLLSALALQKTQTLPDAPPGAEGEIKLPPLAEAQESHGLWSTLRRIFLAMDRMDRATQAHVGSDLNQFRDEFEF